MDNFEFDVELNYKKRRRPIPLLLLAVVSIGLAYGAAYLLRMLVPSIFVEGSVIYTEFFGLVWGLAIVIFIVVYIFGPLHGLKFTVDEGEPVHAGVRIQDDILRITYYDVDRGDGRGPHEEVLELEPEDISRMFGRGDGTEVTIQYRVPDGGTKMV